jgi:filamentous hemagglutinin family protein
MKAILFKSFVGYLVITLLVYLSPVPFAYANPVLQNLVPNGGSNVASAGSATVKTSGNTETITQTTGNAVIDWSSFNIGVNGTTRFVDPNSSSWTVNRIHGTNNPSQILGTLLSNGNVVLINPNGIIFGKGSTVDANGLLATTSNITNADFMAGKFNFTPGGNPTAGIVNQGTITAANAGLVGLVAPNVTNSGIITAKLGVVHLASGDSFTVDLYGDDLMELQVSDAVNQQLVQNTGTINAAGGKIDLTAAASREIIDSLIYVAGELHAPAVAEKGGTIEVYAEGSNAVNGNVAAEKGIEQGNSTVLVSGTVDASGKNAGEKGGNIEILGDDIAILDGSYLDASGAQSGGNIKIGGNFHGVGPTPTAAATIVQNNTTINANALDSGNGGNVAVWSDNETNFAGNIQAKGGPNGGNGGFVETSGKQTLNMQGSVDASAPKGIPGTWLMDPEDVTISTSADSDDPGNPNFVTGGNQATAIVNTTSIDNALNAGTNVTVTTTGSGSAGAQNGPNGGSITVSSPVSATGNATALTTTGSLTLSSYNNININAAITLGGGTNTSSQTVTGGALTLGSANSGNNIGAIHVAGNITTNGGDIIMGGAADPTTGYAIATGNNSGLQIANGVTLSAGTGSISTNSYGIAIGTNDLIETTSGAITLNAPNSGTPYNFSGGAGTTITSNTGPITLTGSTPLTGAPLGGENWIGIQLNTGTTISSTGMGAGVGAITLNGTATSNLTGGESFYFGISGNPTISSVDGDIHLTGIVNSPVGSTGIANIGINLQGTVTSTGSGDIAIYGQGPNNGGGSLFGYLNNGTVITSHNGSITIQGTAQSPTGSTNIGICDGNTGVCFDGGSVQSTGTAPISITGIGANGASDIYFSGNLFGGASDTGAITFNADTLGNSSLPTIQTAGNVNFAPRSTTTTIGVAGGAGTLQIATSGISAGSLTIGSTSGTGNITVGGETLATNTVIQTDLGNIEVTGPQILGTNSLTAITTSDNIQLDSGATITSTAASGTTPIVLAAGGNFTNNAGPSALNSGSGRWIIYSNGSNDDAGGIWAEQTINFRNYSSLPPSSIVSPAYNGTYNTWVLDTVPPPPNVGGGIILPPTSGSPPVTQPGGSAPVAGTSAHPTTASSAAAVQIAETIQRVVAEDPSFIYNSNAVNIEDGTPSAMSPGGYFQMMQATVNNAPNPYTTPTCDSEGSVIHLFCPLFVPTDDPLFKQAPNTSETTTRPTNDRVMQDNRANSYQVADSGYALTTSSGPENTGISNLKLANDTSDSLEAIRIDNEKPITNAEDKKKTSRESRNRLERVVRLWRAIRTGENSGPGDPSPDNG